jgi:hypothetical protein
VSPVQQQPLHLADPRDESLRRTTLIFRLSGPDIQRDLLHEFALHHNVTVSAVESDGIPAIAVDTSDAPSALWDVRATVGMFDDDAEEVSAQ